MSKALRCCRIKVVKRASEGGVAKETRSTVGQPQGGTLLEVVGALDVFTCCLNSLSLFVRDRQHRDKAA
jgi:hypothetical protein